MARARSNARRAVQARRSLGPDVSHVQTSRKRRTRMMGVMRGVGGKSTTGYAPEYQIAARIRESLSPDVLATLPGNAKTILTMAPKERAEMVRLYGPLSKVLKAKLDEFDAEQRGKVEKTAKPPKWRGGTSRKKGTKRKRR